MQVRKLKSEESSKTNVFIIIIASVLFTIPVTFFIIKVVDVMKLYSVWVKEKPRREAQEKYDRVELLFNNTLKRNSIHITDVKYLVNEAGEEFVLVSDELPNGFTVKRVFTKFETKDILTDGQFTFNYYKKYNNQEPLSKTNKGSMNIYISHFKDRKDTEKYKAEKIFVYQEDLFAETICDRSEGEFYCLNQDFTINFEFSKKAWCYSVHYPDFKYECFGY